MKNVTTDVKDEIANILEDINDPTVLEFIKNSMMNVEEFILRFDGVSEDDILAKLKTLA